MHFRSAYHEGINKKWHMYKTGLGLLFQSLIYLHLFAYVYVTISCTITSVITDSALE